MKIWGLIAGALVASGCAQQSQLPAPASAPVPAPRTPEPAIALLAPQPPLPAAVAAYRMRVANEIWLRNAAVYSDPVPEMLKSIVVLELTIDRAGNPVGIAVYRSNGYKHLETRALESIVRAAPFARPTDDVLEGPGTVTFLETFLFRADERFQLRSLVL